MAYGTFSEEAETEGMDGFPFELLGRRGGDTPSMEEEEGEGFSFAS